MIVLCGPAEKGAIQVLRVFPGDSSSCTDDQGTCQVLLKPSRQIRKQEALRQQVTVAPEVI